MPDRGSRGIGEVDRYDEVLDGVHAALPILCAPIPAKTPRRACLHERGSRVPALGESLHPGPDWVRRRAPE